MSRRKRNKYKRKKFRDGASTPREPLSALAGRQFQRIEAYPPTVMMGEPNDMEKEPFDYQTKKAVDSILGVLFVGLVFSVLRADRDDTVNPPKNAELLLLLFLRRDEQEAVLGDLIERYRRLYHRLGKRRANLYAYSEVCRSLCPFIRRLLLDTGIMMLLGNWIKKLIA